jgi:ribosomal protein S18 acetylase RimI-like enzyme
MRLRYVTEQTSNDLMVYTHWRGIRVGYAIAQFTKRPRGLKLCDLTVYTPYRRQGVGRKLLRRVLNTARAAKLPMYLEVGISNSVARYLYHQHGGIEEDGMEKYFMEVWFRPRRQSKNAP